MHASLSGALSAECVGAEFWEGEATKQKSVKRSAFSLNGVQAFSE